MANSKRFSLGFEAGLTVYLTVQRKADSYLLDDADGVFRASPVADFAVAMTADADQPALYEKEEARTSWQDGVHLVGYYLQLGGSPAPSTDPLIASGEMTMEDDQEQTSGDIISSVTNLNTTSTGTGTTGSLATIEKLVRAILHDNKMVLDVVEDMKGKYGNGSSAQKNPSSNGNAAPRRPSR